jgi:hypothetical protein
MKTTYPEYWPQYFTATIYYPEQYYYSSASFLPLTVFRFNHRRRLVFDKRRILLHIANTVAK